ncbi:MarR family winged helix-turn-helix transcriptional regulator [Nocardia sp. BMG51109]|uniref:MarR family winged helix-turn-helix transcriptional regulator n=1 Tax=Nocardia sp. BMG51109 TaxID=1056816 RepID=UPI000467B19F|nr:MarR family transcriptional regulator [Nocardia sp. BMG51109]
MQYRSFVTDTIGAADDGDIVEFLGAVTDVRRMISNLTLPVARKRGISERALGIIVLVYAGLDRPGLLIEYLNVLPSTVSSDVNKLVDAGLLRRKLSPADRRVSRLEVTRKGIAAQQESLRQLHAAFRARSAGVSLDELHACIATLRKLGGEPQPSVPNPLREAGTTD